MGAPHGWRARVSRCSIGLILSDPHSAVLSWVGGERIAISGMPTRHAVPELAEQGVTHVVNCRARPESAAGLVLKYRPQAELVPNYVRSVETWLTVRLSHAAPIAVSEVAVPACGSVAVTSATSPAA